jgi:germination protein M
MIFLDKGMNMLKTTKDIRIYGAIMVFILGLFLVMGYLNALDHKDETFLEVNAYFLNPLTNSLEGELRTVMRGTNEEMTSELLNEVMKRGPRTRGLVSAIPEFITLQEGELIENHFRLQLMFTTNGEVMTPEEELFFKSALSWTMTELPMIRDLHIYINEREMLRADGSPIGLLNRENLVINKAISPFRSEVHRAVLYFTDNAFQGLIAEERVIQVSTLSPQPDMARHVVEQLIAGPSRLEHVATVPPETVIREISTEGDICYVNLSPEAFFRPMTPNGDALLTIFSLVNSLTEIEGIRRVQFLIDSRKVEIVGGGHDLSLPIERDESLIFIEDIR